MLANVHCSFLNAGYRAILMIHVRMFILLCVHIMFVYESVATYVSTDPSTYSPSYHRSISTYLPIYPSTYQPIDLSTYRPVYLSIYLSIYLPIYVPTYLSTYLSIDISIEIYKKLFVRYVNEFSTRVYTVE